MGYLQKSHQRGGEEDHGRRSGHSASHSLGEDPDEIPRQAPRPGAPPNIRPLPYREALMEAERRQSLEYQRLCAGGRLFEPLEREGLSPGERVKRLERRLHGLPRVFQMKREMVQALAALRAKRDRGEITREKFEYERARRAMEFQQMIERGFSPGYILSTEEAELANARCALSKARWELMVATRTGWVPGRLLRRP